MKKILITASVLLVLVLLLLLPVVALDAEETTILACSDFQAPNGNTQGKSQVAEILSAMEKDGITSADGFFACGDYDYEYDDTKGGVTSLKQAVSGVVSENMVFVQGNHDKAVGSDGLSLSGNNDPAHGKYGVFVINEDDYMWYNERENTIKRTAQLLTEYLNEKLASGYNKPIFVLSHLPLNYNMRTRNDGDMMHARYLVNVLNEAGKRGLNIFYLFGHDHSNGWDDYLGGSSVYLKKGDSILVADGTKHRYQETTINFTYLNAGYVGYYQNPNEADDALTMTYITIKGNEVTFVRYDKNGLHNMKSAGVRNAHKNEGPYLPDTTVYASPQTVTLTDISDRTPLAELLPSDKTALRYQRVHSAEDLKDGGRYLIVYNSSTDRFLLPQVVTKANDDGVERIGFEIEITYEFGGEVVFGNFADREWTFVKSNSGWLLEKDGKYATFKNTTTYAVTATLEDKGTVFTVEGSRDAFRFKGGAYQFNYNARMLFNGFPSDPAHFYIYEATGYALEAEGATLGKTSAWAGETVTLTASTPPTGKVFDAWVVEKGTLMLSDATSASITFTMPESGVVLRATYKDAPAETTPVSTVVKQPESTPEGTGSLTPETTPDTESTNTPNENSALAYLVYITIALGFVFALTLAIVVLVNKKKES
ncbi:MAG: metallophosphoesterase [Clostridia bacterium]|nr:metallophosphoesterase [Clostridia bacterium]